MTKKNEKKTGSESKDAVRRQITRREFTLASVAALGSSPLILADQDPDTPPFKLEISEEVHQLMVDRHILEEDLIGVIQYAEKTGDKLYREDSDHFLAKLKMNTVYFYAEYSPVEGGYRIHNTYSHRFTLEGTM